MRSMGDAGSPYVRFQRALKTGNVTLIRTAAKELPAVPLNDALTILLALQRADDDSYERAGVRWVARLALEKPAVSFDDLRLAADAVEALPATYARRDLAEICRRHGLDRAAQQLD